jgi:hypothetical protein
MTSYRAIVASVVVCVIALIIETGALLVGQHRVQRNANNLQVARYQFCVEVEKVRAFGRDSGIRALKQLDKPGSPGYTYYLDNPDELQAAVRNAQHTIDAFSPPIHCDRFSEGKPPVEEAT